MWIVELGFIRPLAVAVMALLMPVPVDFSFAMINIDTVPAGKLPIAMLVYNYPEGPFSSLSAPTRPQLTVSRHRIQIDRRLGSRGFTLIQDARQKVDSSGVPAAKPACVPSSKAESERSAL
jgi:hypothetical protein